MRSSCDGASEGEEACPGPVTMETTKGEEAHMGDIV